MRTYARTSSSAHTCATHKKQWKYSEKIEKHIYFSETLKIMEKIVYGRSRVAEERSSEYRGYSILKKKILRFLSGEL